MIRNNFFVLILAAIVFLPVSAQAQVPKLPKPKIPHVSTEKVDKRTHTSQKPVDQTANGVRTQVTVNVYKIGTAPFWHTGTVINEREYYFDTNNKVRACAPKGMGLKHHRTITRMVPGNMQHVEAVLASVKSRWNGTRYDLGKHNCDFFTDDLLRSLGSSGLDQEYLNASGLEKGLRQVPGGATAQEILVKDPRNARLGEAAKEDSKRAAKVPDDTRKEAQRAGGKASDKAKKAGGSISDAGKKAKKKLGF